MMAFRSLSIAFVRFSGVGAIATVVHFGVLTLLVEAQMAAPLAASLVGFVSGAMVAYMMNYYLTFGSELPHRYTLWRFLVVAWGGMLLNMALMAIMLNLAGAHYLLAQVMATAVVLLWNFLMNLVWTFRGTAHAAR